MDITLTPQDFAFTLIVLHTGQVCSQIAAEMTERIRRMGPNPLRERAEKRTSRAKGSRRCLLEAGTIHLGNGNDLGRVHGIARWRSLAR